MAVSRVAVLFLFLLVVAAEMGRIDAKGMLAKPSKTITGLTLEKEKQNEESKKEESRCSSESKEFKGFCLNSNNCAKACTKEGFLGGECKQDLVSRKCVCKKC